MVDIITYPTADMQRTAKEIRAILDAQWQQHLALFKNAPHSLTAVTRSLVNGLPGGRGEALLNQMEDWHLKMAKEYAMLYALADALESGAIKAETFDEGLERIFNRLTGH